MPDGIDQARLKKKKSPGRRGGTMTGDSITSQDLSLAQIFLSFYWVPYFQGEYV